MRRLLASLPLLLAPAAPLAAQVEAVLVPEASFVRPAGPVRVTVRISVEPGWHIYAGDPGGIGLPTEVRWRGPAGLVVEGTDWPRAEWKELPGGGARVYQGEVEVVSTLRTPPGLRPGEVLEVAAELAWGACREVCIPQRSRLLLRLPVRERAPPPARR